MKAVYLLGAHYEMVDDDYVMPPRLRGDLQREFDVLSTRRRVATGMVVDEYQRRGAEFRRSIKHRTDGHGNSGSGAFPDLLVAYQPISRVEMENPDALGDGEAEIEAQIVRHLRQAGKKGSISDPRPKNMHGRGIEAGDAPRRRPSSPDDASDAARRSRKNGTEGSELREELVRPSERIILTACGDYPSEMPSLLPLRRRHRRTPTARMLTIGQPAQVAISW